MIYQGDPSVPLSHAFAGRTARPWFCTLCLSSTAISCTVPLRYQARSTPTQQRSPLKRRSSTLERIGINGNSSVNHPTDVGATNRGRL
jgi:hypothetical protein